MYVDIIIKCIITIWWNTLDAQKYRNITVQAVVPHNKCRRTTAEEEEQDKDEETRIDRTSSFEYNGKFMLFFHFHCRCLSLSLDNVTICIKYIKYNVLLKRYELLVLAGLWN